MTSKDKPNLVHQISRQLSRQLSTQLSTNLSLYKNQMFSKDPQNKLCLNHDIEEPKNNTSAENTKETGRGEWSNQFEFVLSTMGYAVGLGNVWRFPYLVYKNGGGTFLIPYFLMLVFAGLPLFFMELVLGQYSGQGPTKVFGRISPIFKGIGWSMVLATFFVSLYYNVIIAWTLFYMFKGFAAILPWSSCTEYSSHHCIDLSNDTITINDTYPAGPSEDFFLHQMLGLEKETYNWDNFGIPKWDLVLCLLAAWILVCLCLIKGVKSSGKVKEILTFKYKMIKIPY